MRRRLAVSCPIPPVAACPLGNSVGAIESVARRQGSSGAFDARGWACDPSPPYLHGNAHIRLPSGGCPSGERVSNTWATCPQLWDNSKKLGLIPDMTADRMVWWWKDLSAGDGPAAYQLVGGVVAYQGDDG